MIRQIRQNKNALLFKCIPILFLLAANKSAFAQNEFTDQPADIQRLIRDGRADELDSRLRGGRNPREFQLLAIAYANQALKAKSPAERKQAFSRAAHRHEKWIDALQKKGGAVPSAAATAARLANAHLAYGTLLLGKMASPLLDQYDLQAGQGTDRNQLIDILEKAETQYRAALKLAMPLYEQRADRSEDFQIAGIYDDIQRASLDGQFNLAWTQLYLGRLQPATAKELARLKYRSSEAAFANLLNAGFSGESALQCRIGLGMSKCSLGNVEDGANEFGRVIREAKEPRVAAQARCELARCLMENDRFDEARKALQPIRSESTTARTQTPGYYKTLADLRYADTYFAEAETSRRVGRIAQAQAARVKAIAEMDKLASRGGRWPQIVQLYLRKSVDPDANPRNLSPAELLVAARILLDRGDAASAAERVRIALAMPRVTRDLDAPLRLELGRCEYKLGNHAQAAEIFQNIALVSPIGDEAAQAATYAYQLLGRAAEQSRNREKFAELAEFLRKLEGRFPGHENIADIRWLHAASLERSGQFAAAARAYGNIQPSSKRAEEARFRQVLCSKSFAQNEDNASPADEIRGRMREAARLLSEYANSVTNRAAGSPDAGRLLRFATEARLHAAELFVDPIVKQPDDALQILDRISLAAENRTLLPKVLSLKIQALRQEKRFEDAAAMGASILSSLPPNEAQALLAELAEGMSEEVIALRDAGDTAAATELARQTLNTLEKLNQSIGQSASLSAEQKAQVQLMRAQMLYAAGDYDKSRKALNPIIKSNKSSGPVRRLDARLKTATLTEKSSWKDIETAQAAWAAFLRDEQLRTQAPDVYWEARYHWLALAQRLGKSADVEQAIRTERVWYPDMGGKRWQNKFTDLYAKAQQDMKNK